MYKDISEVPQTQGKRRLDDSPSSMKTMSPLKVSFESLATDSVLNTAYNNSLLTVSLCVHML